MQKGTNSPLSWVGGKSQMASRLIEIFSPHRCYVEVFGGAGWVLFKKPYTNKAGYREVYNDIDGELVNMFRVFREDPDGFLREMDLMLISRQVWTELLKTPPPRDNKIKQAARFFFLVKASFGGKGGTFGMRTSGVLVPNLITLRKTIGKVHERLKSVLIEHLDFRKLIEVYDRPYTLFFLDPPYWNTDFYRFNFEDQDYSDLVDLLRKLQGKFIMTHSESPFVQDLFKDFIQQKVTTRYSLHWAPNSRGKRRQEILISNYDPDRSEKWLENK